MQIGETKINVFYDDIKVLDSNLGYYLVKSNSKFGVINSDEELIIHIEYDSIGINTTEFGASNLKSQYILYDTLIPVCLNKKWGLFDVEGKKVTDAEYDSLGCINSSIKDKKVDNVITIGDTEVVVVSKDKKYGLITTKGDLLGTIRFEYVYSITSEGETTYWLGLEGLDYNALDFIKLMKERLGYNASEGENNNDQQQGEEQNQNQENNQQNQDENSNNPEDEQGQENQNNDNNQNNDVPQENTNPEDTNNQTNPVESYNLKFEPYAGERSKGSVRSLLDTIQEANLTHENKIQLEFNGNTYVTNTSDLKPEIVNNVYTVTIQKNEETGYVEKIVIS